MINTKFRDIVHLMNQKPFRDFKNDLSECVISNLKKVILEFDKKYILNNKKEVIQNMIRYNVDGDWVERLKNGDKYKKDGFSMEALIVKYGESVAKLISDERNDKVAITKDKYIRNHSEHEWEELCKKKRSNLGLDGYIKKYGHEEGLKKWNNYLKKWKIGIEKKKADGWKNGLTIEEYQTRYGIKEGYERWRKRINSRKYTLSLEGYINKHGGELGKKLWGEYCKSNNKTSLESFIKRYGEKFGKEKYVLMLEKIFCYLKNRRCYSIISQELFKNVADKLENKNDIKYAIQNGEQYFFINENFCKGMFVDFKYGNIIIEFYGDFWHANPSKYKENDIVKLPNNNKLANKVWSEDKEKIDWLVKRGYNVMIVWESDYLKNKNEVVQSCLNFIKQNYK